MLCKPAEVSDECITDALKNAFLISDTQEFQFLPVGNDSNAFIYSVTGKIASKTESSRFFLKLKKRCGLTFSALLVPSILSQEGIEEAVAPLCPRNAEELENAQTVDSYSAHSLELYSARVGNTDYYLLAYPYIEGKSGMECGLSHVQWYEFGSLISRVHEMINIFCKSSTFSPPVESFNSIWGRKVRAIDKLICDYFETANEPLAQQQNGFCASESKDIFVALETNNIGKKFAYAWKERRKEIFHVLSRCEELGHEVANVADPSTFVLCHGDMHTANVLISNDEQHSDFTSKRPKLWLVDWDECCIAPKERDLMFLFDETRSANSAEVAMFLRGYFGCNASNPLPFSWQHYVDKMALAYYRYEWAVQELGDSADRILLMQAGLETLTSALQDFEQLFSPGNVIQHAYKLDKSIL